MFSIARYNGDADENNDSRTLEKKQERLNKLNARIANKKRKDDSSNDQKEEENTEKKRKSNTTIDKEEPKKVESNETEPSNTQSKTSSEKKKKNASEKKAQTAEEVEAMEIDNEEQETTNEKEEEEEEEQVTEQAEIPTLEAFPDLLGPKTKHSKEDVKILRNMGIPEWMLQPTVVSPRDSCDLDKAGLSEHIIQRCKDLGLSSLFAGKESFYKNRPFPSNNIV